jgi:phytoene dehydrogenase-like protein
MNESLAIVGGGLAGLAAAVAATDRGFRVELFERTDQLGGRANSLVDSETGQRIDHCQHVAMGCCTALLDFCRRTGLDDCFQRSNRLHFIGPDGRQCDFAPVRWLPAPFHLLPGLLRLNFLSLHERWGIIRALRQLTRISPLPPGEGPGVRANLSPRPLAGEGQGVRAEAPHSPHPNPLPAGEGNIGAWLRRHGQSDRAIERFWSIVLISALGETLDYVSLSAAQKVFRDGFIASRRSSDLLLPRMPLGAIFNDRLGRWLADHGVTIHLSTPIRQIVADRRRAIAVVLPDGAQREFDSFVVAVPWREAKSLFDAEALAAMPALAAVDRIEPAAITAVHLWFDRPMVPLPHAVLVGRLSQWVFATNEATAPHHCQVVISASHRLPPRKHDDLIAHVRGELESIWSQSVGVAQSVGAMVEDVVGVAVELPPPRQCVGVAVELPPPRLLHARVITQASAIFSVQPGVDRFRPPQQTPLKNLALAGDWTATGWPATMESAIRSGRLAVDSLQIPNLKSEI